MYDAEFDLMAPCSTTGDQAKRSFSFQIPLRLNLIRWSLYLGSGGHGHLMGGRQVDAPSIEENN